VTQQQTDGRGTMDDGREENRKICEARGDVMPVNYSLIPTEDLKALRAKDFGSVSTPTLQYIKTGDAAGMQLQKSDPNKIEHSVPQKPPQRPRETVLGVENVPAQGSNVQPQLRKGPGFWRRMEEDLAAIEDVPRTLIQQGFAFPASKVAGAAAVPYAAWNYPANWLASKLRPAVTNPPRNPLAVGQDIERRVHDFIAQPNRPRADLTTDAVKKVNELPPLQLMNKPFEATQGVRNYFTERGYPNLGYAAETAADLALMWHLIRGGKEAGPLGEGELENIPEEGWQGEARGAKEAPVVADKSTEGVPDEIGREGAYGAKQDGLETHRPIAEVPGKGYPARIPSVWYQKAIQSFVDEIGRLRGKTLPRETIFSQYENNPVPIGEINSKTRAQLNLQDPKVYTGKAYFIDHHFNHHPENDVAAYHTIPDVLAHPDDVRVDARPGQPRGYIFVKHYDKYHTLITRVSEEQGHLMLYKTFVTARQEPYKNLPSIDKEPVGEGGHFSIGSAPEKGAPPGAVSGLPTGRETSVPGSGGLVKPKPSVIENKSGQFPAGGTTTKGRLTDPDLQKEYLQKAGGNIEKAHWLARKDGWEW
jgi:hypothetical protein